MSVIVRYPPDSTRLHSDVDDHCAIRDTKRSHSLVHHNLFSAIHAAEACRGVI